jgi:hypothetical protein
MAGRCSVPRASVVIFDAGTAGARIAGQFRVVMPLVDDDHRVCGSVTNCVTITAYGGGLPWILRDV